MVSDTLRTISNAEKELERMADCGEPTDETEKYLKETRHLAEKTTFSAIRFSEKWGKTVLEHAKGKIIDMEEIIL